MAKVILEISGGVVQWVFSDIPDVEVMKVEWLEKKPSSNDVEVGRLAVDPLDTISFETAQALESASSMKSRPTT